MKIVFVNARTKLKFEFTSQPSFLDEQKVLLVCDAKKYLKMKSGKESER